MDEWERRRAVAKLANSLLRERYSQWPEVIPLAERVLSILTGGFWHDSVGGDEAGEVTR